MKDLKKKALSVWDFVFCVILSLAFTASDDYIKTGSFTPSVGYFLAAFALFAALIFITYLLRNALAKPVREQAPEKGILKFAVRMMESRFHILSPALLIFLCWLPALWFLYPGTCINDTWGQMTQVVHFLDGEPAWGDHHPLFDTLLMGFMIVPFARKTGEWHFAFFFYVLLQAGLTALAFSAVLHYAYDKLKLGIKPVFVMFLVYCFLPIYPASVQTISKDALYTWIFVFYTLHYIETVRTEGESLGKGKFLFFLSLTAVFCCLTKKIGLYITLLSLAVLFLFIRKNRLRLLIPAACAVLVMNVILPQVFIRMNVTPGGQQEKYSLPFQMTARYLRDYPDDITEEEYEVIDRVLDADRIAEAYDPTFADPVKLHCQKGENGDYPEYLKVWFRMGLRHPDAYIAAANSMLSGWFSWTKYAPLMNMDHRNQLDSRYIPKYAANRFISEETAISYENMFEKLYQNPFTRLFFTYGFYASLLPAFFAATVLRKWKSGKPYWLALVPLFFTLLIGVWLAPASIFLEGMRYLYPVTYTIPLYFAYCVYIYRENN